MTVNSSRVMVLLLPHINRLRLIIYILNISIDLAALFYLVLRVTSLLLSRVLGLLAVVSAVLRLCLLLHRACVLDV